MNPEKTKRASSENLTRRQKLLRRAVPIALVAAGTAGVAGHELSKDSDTQPEAYAKATSHVSTVAVFGGAESGWGHDTAEHALKQMIYDGAARAYAGMDMNGDGHEDISEDELESIVDDVPTYEQANQILEMAHYDEVLPDRGDKLLIELDVTADSDKVITFTVTDAKIQDISNNQE